MQVIVHNDPAQARASKRVDGVLVAIGLFVLIRFGVRALFRPRRAPHEGNRRETATRTGLDGCLRAVPDRGRVACEEGDGQLAEARIAKTLANQRIGYHLLLRNRLTKRSGAHSSAGERPLHTREVPGSIPGVPTLNLAAKPTRFVIVGLCSWLRMIGPGNELETPRGYLRASRGPESLGGRQIHGDACARV
jgi:hypothetical protein